MQGLHFLSLLLLSKDLAQLLESADMTGTTKQYTNAALFTAIQAGTSLSSFSEMLACLCCVQNIALSPAELGDLIDIVGGGGAGKNIYHDPNKGRAG